MNAADKAKVKANRDKRSRERQVFYEQVWPTLLVRLRLAGAPEWQINNFKTMRSRYRWGQRHALIDAVKRYESELIQRS